MHHHIDTTAGTTGVEAAEPFPGLLVYELPPGFCDEARHRWMLEHHSSGSALASFASRDTAEQAASAVSGLADWTKTVEEMVWTATPDFAATLESALRDAGGSWWESCVCQSQSFPA